MMDVIFGFLSSLGWGFLFASGITALVVWLIVQFFNIERLYQVVVGVVMWLLLLFQMSAMVASLKIDDYVEDAQRVVAAITDSSQAREAADSFVEEFPMVYKFVDKDELASAASIPSEFLAQLHDEMVWYAWRRAGWSFGIIAIAFGVCGIFLARPSSTAIPLDSFGNPGGGAGGVQF